jgi:signal transduction histidine kinase
VCVLAGEKGTLYSQADGLDVGRIKVIRGLGQHIWVGGERGLMFFHEGGFRRVTFACGAQFGAVSGIVERSDGSLWLNEMTGIIEIPPEEIRQFVANPNHHVNYRRFDYLDGLPGAAQMNYTNSTAVEASDGRLWFATDGGLAWIDPARLITNAVPPPVSILSIGSEKGRQPISEAVKFAPGTRTVEIDYTALSLSIPERVRFRYKLEGLDAEWQDVGTRRQAYYNNLAPRQYRFRLIACNNDGVWNEAGASLEFSIAPAYYQTTWFTLMLFLAGASAVSLAWRYRASQLKREHATQEAFSRQLIDSQEQERKRIAAELHDSLGQHLLIIKNWAIVAMASLTDHDAAKEPVDEISSTAGQAIEEVRQIAYNLRPYQLERLGLTTALQDLVSQVAASSSIRLSGQVDAVDGVFPKDAELSIYRIVQEALNNTIRHSEATQVWLAVSRRAGVVETTIQDNGRGFALEAGNHRDPKRNGFGLLDIAERVRMLGGQTNIQSSPGRGCTIHISLETREPSR